MTAINFDNALGMHATALEFRSARAQVLASNIANAETVGYRARDISFTEALKALNNNSQQGRLDTTDSRHIGGGAVSNSSFFNGHDAGVLQLVNSGESSSRAKYIASQVQGFRSFYRDSIQQSGLDGNTVDVQRESVDFAKNALDFSVSFRLLNGKFSGLTKAIKGE